MFFVILRAKTINHLIIIKPLFFVDYKDSERKTNV